MKTIDRLLPLIQGDDHVFIQTHNFPDPDAVVSAFGLQQLLSHFQITSYLVYEGEIQRRSLSILISELGIDIHPSAHYSIDPHHRIILVDGCKGNKTAGGSSIQLEDPQPIYGPISCF